MSELCETEMTPADVPLSQREINNKKNSLYLNFFIPVGFSNYLYMRYRSQPGYGSQIMPGQSLVHFFFSIYYDL